eukprot:CAMPEP_0182475548 /NCGR_PEP_ID=MMETSP1319-20130603/27568_1 /TAXON_ID=172717 /ORGANISM="Bolidomonas pacifica, Strain RCC208" /LENGTH=276 /DNA_ID=CAMNT_0024676547 /DNA_START=8 /DNA_END=838 /DNA_ORIENTATION=+
MTKTIAFLAKLSAILTNSDPAIISWCADGVSFTINNIQRLTAEILSQYFRHNNFSSFQRQLHYFQFRKESRLWKYSHPLFQRDRPELMSLMKRQSKSTKPKGSGKGGASSASPSSSSSPSASPKAPVTVAPARASWTAAVSRESAASEAALLSVIGGKRKRASMLSGLDTLAHVVTLIGEHEDLQRQLKREKESEENWEVRRRRQLMELGATEETVLLAPSPLRATSPRMEDSSASDDSSSVGSPEASSDVAQESDGMDWQPVQPVPQVQPVQLVA